MNNNEFLVDINAEFKEIKEAINNRTSGLIREAIETIFEETNISFYVTRKDVPVMAFSNYGIETDRLNMSDIHKIKQLDELTEEWISNTARGYMDDDGEVIDADGLSAQLTAMSEALLLSSEKLLAAAKTTVK